MMRRTGFLCLLSLLVLPAAAQDTLEVGFGRRSLVASRRTIPLAGYGGRGLVPFHGVHDEVEVKAMIVRSGEAVVGLVTADLIGVQRTILDALREVGFPDRVGLTVDDLMVSASHAHSSYGGLARPTGGVVLDGLFLVTCGPFQERFFDEIVERIGEAIVDAWDDLAPARLGVGSREVAGLSRNRGRSGDVTDPELGLVKVTDLEGTVRGLVVNFTAHPVLLGADNFLVSAGFPGAMARDLERRYPGSTVLFTNGAEGDQSPTGAPGPHADDWAKVEATGVRLAGHFADLVGDVAVHARVGVAARSETLSMPVPTEGRYFLKYVGGQKRSVFSHLVLGDALLMGVPGEPCCRIGLDLKAAARERGFGHAFVIGLAQDHCGYFVHADDYGPGLEASHDYEKGLNFYGPGIGRFLVETATERLDPRPLAVGD